MWQQVNIVVYPAASWTIRYIHTALNVDVFVVFAKFKAAISKIACFNFFTAVLSAVAIILFGVKGKSDYGLDLSGNLRFDWGLWMGVAGVGISVICAIFFLVQGGRQNYDLK